MLVRFCGRDWWPIRRTILLSKHVSDLTMPVMSVRLGFENDDSRVTRGLIKAAYVFILYTLLCWSFLQSALAGTIEVKRVVPFSDPYNSLNFSESTLAMSKIMCRNEIGYIFFIIQNNLEKEELKNVQLELSSLSSAENDNDHLESLELFIVKPWKQLGAPAYRSLAAVETVLVPELMLKNDLSRIPLGAWMRLTPILGPPS